MQQPRIDVVDAVFQVLKEEDPKAERPTEGEAWARIVACLHQAFDSDTAKAAMQMLIEESRNEDAKAR